MSDAGAFYQILVLPSLFVFRVLKAIVATPFFLLFWIVLLPFRILYSFLGSLWWVLPYGSRHSTSHPPTPFDFLLSSLLVGLIAGLVLYLTSRVLFVLPDLFEGSSISLPTANRKLVPSRAEVQKRIREQAAKVQLLQEVKQDPIRVNSTGNSNKSSRPESPGQHRFDLGRGTAQDWGSRDPVNWDWQQLHQDPSQRPQLSPTVATSTLAGRDNIGVARQTIVEESSDDEDSDYFY